MKEGARANRGNDAIKSLQSNGNRLCGSEEFEQQTGEL